MSLSIYVTVPSACGKITDYSIEIEDAELNPYGIACCAECVNIIARREAEESK